MSAGAEAFQKSLVFRRVECGGVPARGIHTECLVAHVAQHAFVHAGRVAEHRDVLVAVLGVLLDVGHKRLRARVRPEMRVHELAARVVDHGGGPRAHGVHRGGNADVRVRVAGVAHRELLEEGLGGPVVVVRIDAEERHPLAELHGHLLEHGELLPAGAAPGGPLVHDHRMAPQCGEPLLESARAAAEQLSSLLVDRDERGRRSLEGLRLGRLARGGALRVRSTTGEKRGAEQAGDCEAHRR